MQQQKGGISVASKSTIFNNNSNYGQSTCDVQRVFAPNMHIYLFLKRNAYGII